MLTVDYWGVRPKRVMGRTEAVKECKSYIPYTDHIKVEHEGESWWLTMYPKDESDDAAVTIGPFETHESTLNFVADAGLRDTKR